MLEAPDEPVRVGEAVALSIGVDDPGRADTHTCEVDWGDGTTTVVDVQQGTCSVEHSYSGPGLFAATVAVTDDDGDRSTASVGLMAFDPALAVSGTGKYLTPEDARAESVQLQAEVRFHVHAKYVQPSSVLKGEVFVELKAGDQLFRARELQWLVAANGQALVFAEGTLDGTPGFQSFIQVAQGSAGSEDAIRIRIWHSDSGEVAYDDQPSAPLFTAPTQPLRSGEIRVDE